MRYLRPTSTFRLRSFAFAFRLQFAFRLSAGAPARLGAAREQFFRRRPEALSNRPANLPPDLLTRLVPMEPLNAGMRATAGDAFLDREMRVGERRDLRLVRDAEYLKRRPERVQLSANDFGHPSP